MGLPAVKVAQRRRHQPRHLTILLPSSGSGQAEFTTVPLKRAAHSPARTLTSSSHGWSFWSPVRASLDAQGDGSMAQVTESAGSSAYCMSDARTNVGATFMVSCFRSSVLLVRPSP